MYNVILDKQTFQAGRELALAVSNANRFSCDKALFPAGTNDLVRFFLTQARDTWKEYRACQMDYFGTATRAMTSLTLAGELIADLHFAMRMVYNPTAQELDANSPTTEHRQFYTIANQTLKLMSDVINFLKKRKATDARFGEQSACLDYHNRLTYAAHLADLGVRMTAPYNYRYHHPDAAKWQTLRSAVRRNQAAALIALAKLDEAEGHKFRCQNTDGTPL